jgi:hypothetical protein
MSAVKEKSLPLAIGLNLVLAGAGYMYMGRVVLGLGALLVVGFTIAFSGLLFAIPTWLVLNVIMVIDMLLLSNKNKAAVAAAHTRKCPSCAETIQKEAKICRFCQTKLTSSVEVTAPLGGGSVAQERVERDGLPNGVFAALVVALIGIILFAVMR